MLRLAILCLLLAVGALAGARLGAAETLRVCLVGAEGADGSSLEALRLALEPVANVRLTPLAPTRPAGGAARFAALRSAHGLVVHRGPGSLGPEDAAILTEFLRAGKGCVVLAASTEAWPAMPGLLPEILGATPGEPFAGGAPMTVINLFPHPIFAGVERFETGQSMGAFTKLADDVQMIMEGTVGEETTPLAWVRQRPSGRICHLVPAGPDTVRDPSYRRIVGHALLWTLGRPIPGAQANVQRTYMPEAHPGSIAITFPQGPGVCLDPVRGGINYIWDGDFVDLRPRWLTKQGAPARIFGDVFYREKTNRPLRQGAPDNEPDLHFRGYALRDGRPEFHYLIDGRDVYETIDAVPDGRGIVRRFRVGPGRGPLWLNLEAQSGAAIALRGLERDGDRGCFPSSGAGEFTIEIRRQQGGLGR